MSFVTPLIPLATDEDFGLDKLLQALVVGVTGLDGALVRVRWVPVPYAQPKSDVSWCAIGALSTQSNGSPFIEYYDGANYNVDTVAHLRNYEAIDVVASFYGPNNKSIAGILRDGLSLPDNRQVLEQAGCGVHSIGQVINLPELVGGEFRGRADLHLTFTRQIDRIYQARTYPPTTLNIIPNR